MLYQPFRDSITTIQSPLLDENSPFHKDKKMGSTLNQNMNIMLKTAKLDPRFPHAKYINVVKLNESKRKYVMYGMKQNPRIYCIGVLTNDNHYYYSELRTTSTSITRNLIRKMNMIFSGYNIDRETSITFSADIADTNEPIDLFLSIICNATGSLICRAPYIKQLRRINKMFQYIRPQGKKRTVKTTRIAIQQHGMLLNKLIKNERFDFLVGENDIITNREKYTKQEFQKRLMAAMGILYMYTKEKNREYDLKCKLKKEKKKEIMENKNGCQ